MINDIGGNNGYDPGRSMLENIEQQRDEQIDTHASVQQQQRMEWAVLLDFPAHKQLFKIRHAFSCPLHDLHLLFR
ncbi:hypothetical protein D3C81_1510870 [compost metagenome]